MLRSRKAYDQRHLRGRLIRIQPACNHRESAPAPDIIGGRSERILTAGDSDSHIHFILPAADTKMPLMSRCHLDDGRRQRGPCTAPMRRPAHRPLAQGADDDQSFEALPVKSRHLGKGTAMPSRPALAGGEDDQAGALCERSRCTRMGAGRPPRSTLPCRRRRLRNVQVMLNRHVNESRPCRGYG